MFCDLSHESLTARAICQMSATRRKDVPESSSADSFTSAFLETIEELIHDDEREFSVIEAFNACYLKFSDKDHPPDFKFAHTIGFDPDTLAWPLVPPEDWAAPAVSPASPGRQQLPLQAPSSPSAAIAAAVKREEATEALSPNSAQQRMRKQVTFNEQALASSQELFAAARGQRPHHTAPPRGMTHTSSQNGMETQILNHVPSINRTPSAASSCLPSHAALQSMPTTSLNSNAGSPGTITRQNTESLQAQGIYATPHVSELAKAVPTQWLQTGTQSLQAQGSEGCNPVGTQWFMNPSPSGQLPVAGMHTQF